MQTHVKSLGGSDAARNVPPLTAKEASSHMLLLLRLLLPLLLTCEVKDRCLERVRCMTASAAIRAGHARVNSMRDEADAAPPWHQKVCDLSIALTSALTYVLPLLTPPHPQLTLRSPSAHHLHPPSS